MNLLAVFDQLLQNEAFVDVTLACEGVSLKAHKMVLSACSPYFQTLFLDNPCKHPIVILNSMRYIDLKAIIDFMYKGEVNVSQDQLSALLKTAEMLKVKGLAEVTNQTKQNIVAGGAMPPLSASPPLPHVGQRSPPHIRTSLSPPPKRKKLRTSAMSSAASSPQTPTMSSSIPASSVTDSSQPVLDPKIVSQTSLADLSQDGHSDPDGLSRHSSAEQNNDSVPDLRLEPTLEIKEDHSPSTSNMASDMSYDALPPDLSNTDHPGMDTSSLSAGPSTSGIQSQSSEKKKKKRIRDAKVVKIEPDPGADDAVNSLPKLAHNNNTTDLTASSSKDLDDGIFNAGKNMPIDDDDDYEDNDSPATKKTQKGAGPSSLASAAFAAAAAGLPPPSPPLELASRLAFVPAEHPLERTSVHRRCKVCHHLYRERHETALVCATCKIFICNPRRRGCYNIHTELAGYLRYQRGKM